RPVGGEVAVPMPTSSTDSGISPTQVAQVRELEQKASKNTFHRQDSKNVIPNLLKLLRDFSNARRDDPSLTLGTFAGKRDGLTGPNAHTEVRRWRGLRILQEVQRMGGITGSLDGVGELPESPLADEESRPAGKTGTQIGAVKTLLTENGYPVPPHVD